MNYLNAIFYAYEACSFHIILKEIWRLKQVKIFSFGSYSS